MKSKKTIKAVDCRSKAGKAISLIDTISILCSQLGSMRGKIFDDKSVKEAIRDLQGDEAAYYVINKLSLTKEKEATNILINEVVSNLTQKERNRIKRIMTKL
jgi:hypothetical protein